MRFAEKAKLLKANTSGTLPLEWTEPEQRVFEDSRKALVSVLVLTHLEISKQFHLYVDEAKGIAKGVLVQTVGPWKRPVACLSKRLDTVVSGLLVCIMATVALPCW